MRLTTGGRLAVGLGVVSVVMLAAAVLALARLDGLNRQVYEIAIHDAPRLKQARSIMALANAVTRDTFRMAVAAPPAREGIMSDIRQKRGEITEELAALAAAVDSDAGRALLEEVRRKRDAYVASYGAVAEMLRAGRDVEAVRLLTGETFDRLDLFSEAMDKFLAQEIAQLQQSAETANRQTERDRSLLIAYVVAGFVAAVAFALWVIRTVTGPLGGEPDEARRIALSIASGEMDGEIRLREGDSDSLMAALKAMQEHLRLMVAQMREDARELQALNDRLEERVRERTAKLEASNQELEGMSFAVAHDLRQPLRAIEGFSSVLREDCEEHLDLECRDTAGRIAHGARRMSEMIDAMMGLARLSRSDFERRPIDLTAVAHGVAEELAMLEPARQAEFLIAENMPAEADAALLRAILQNLIGNAWKFSRTRERAVIEVGCQVEHGRRVYYVRDNGVGFNMEHAKRLFSPFQRFHTNERFEGHGIGLASVRRAVRRHEGQIWAESEPGKGATFFFTLEGDAETFPRFGGIAGAQPLPNGA